MTSTLPIIVNPMAGGGRCGKQITGTVQRLRAEGLTVEVHRTREPGHASALARQIAAAGYSRMLVAGGDGTTFEVVDGLFPHDGPRPTLGLLPLGTGNSFLKDFGIDDAEAAIDAVLRGKTRAVDVVRAHHAGGTLHYVNLLSVGFTSAVGATTNRWFKPLGAAGYAVSTVLEVARLAPRSFPHRLDGGDLDEADYVLLSFSNSRCTGGDMQMAPDADPSDGRLDVIRVGPLGRVDLLRTFPKIYAGTHLEHPLNSGTTATEVEFELPGPVDVMVDGEVMRLHLTQLTVLHHALEVMA